MSSAAHRGDHDIAFYEAAIEETHRLDVTATYSQLPDVDGPLRPGRYLIQLFNPSNDTAVCWVHVGKFEKAVSLAGTAGPGVRRVPLSKQAIIAIETHVLVGHSDRIGAIMSAGTGTLFVTRVSSETRTGYKRA